MSSPTLKYQNLKMDPIDGTPLSWRAHPEGFPTRTKDVPHYVERQRQQAASEVFFAQSKFFTLPKDNEKYTAVIDWISNGMAILREERIRELPGDKPDEQWLVWITYLDIRGHIPTDQELSAQFR